MHAILICIDIQQQVDSQNTSMRC